MLRRIPAILAAVLLGACVLAAPTQAAVDPTCTFSPPARISVFQEVTELTPSFSGTCREAPAGYASWSARTADQTGNAALAGFDLHTDAYATVYDIVELGAVTWHPNYAGTHRNTEPCGPGQTRHCDTDLTAFQNQPVTVIKLAPAAWLTGSRSGSTVTLSVTSHTWSPTAHRFFAHAMGGELQIQNANGTWSRLGDPFFTAGNGKRSFPFTVAGARTFRYAIYSTGYSWDKVSTSLTR